MMIDILNTVAPILDVFGSIQISTEHLHEAGEAVEHLHVDEHLHETEGVGGVLSEVWSVMKDPAHAISEIAYNIAWDLVVIPVTILLYKKIREPKLRASIHKEIDDEHGITHKECSGSDNTADSEELSLDGLR